MRNPVRILREHLGLSQPAFAALIGRSHQSVQGYEHGRPLPAEVIGKLKHIAAERGLADIALALTSDQWHVKRVINPGETLISQHRPVEVQPGEGYPHGYNPLNRAWHDMLERILESGDEKAVQAVQPNLIIFDAWVNDRSAPSKTNQSKVKKVSRTKA